MRSENAVGVSPTWKGSQNLPMLILITRFDAGTKGFAHWLQDDGTRLPLLQPDFSGKRLFFYCSPRGILAV